MNTVISPTLSTRPLVQAVYQLPNIDATCTHIKLSPLGENLSDADCYRLAEICRYRHLNVNEYLIHDGEIDDSLYVIVTGKLGVVKCDQRGECVPLHILHAGDIAGELGFIDGTPHSAGLRAINECEVLTLCRSDFESLIRTYPLLGYNVMRAIMRTAHTILRRMNFQYVQLTNYIHGKY